MDITELYYPQIAIQIGPYTIQEGVELEVYSEKESLFDWAKIRFTGQYGPALSIEPKAAAAISFGYDGIMERVFAGYVSRPPNGADHAGAVYLKDDMMRLQELLVSDTFLDVTPQEVIHSLLQKAGITERVLSSQRYPARKQFSLVRQTAAQAISAINATWGIKASAHFMDGVFYWDTTAEQGKIYTFEYGVNILDLTRSGSGWMLETVSVPFVRHSHKINVIHPKVRGEFEVSKVVFFTNDAGFIRTNIYF